MIIFDTGGPYAFLDADVLAAGYRTADLLSIDHRHFRAMRPLRGGDAFRPLPYDQ